MNHMIARLMRDLNPQKPNKEDLHFVFLQAVQLLHLNDKGRALLERAFEISYEGHKLAPVRASGEIYFMHVFRQFLYAVYLMCEHGVVSVEILAGTLLHDTVEDAKKGMSTPFIAKSQIHLLLNDSIAYFVMCVTKKTHPIKEARDIFLKRIISCDAWQVLVMRPFDGNDNIETLAAVEKEKQMPKVREVFELYPLMEERAIHLITIAGEKGDLPHHERWIRLVKELHKTLRANALKQKKRIEEEMMNP